MTLPVRRGAVTTISSFAGVGSSEEDALEFAGAFAAIAEDGEVEIAAATITGAKIRMDGRLALLDEPSIASFGLVKFSGTALSRGGLETTRYWGHVRRHGAPQALPPCPFIHAAPRPTATTTPSSAVFPTLATIANRALVTQSLCNHA